MMKEWRLEEDMRHRGEELEEAGVDSVVNGSVEVNNNGQGTSKVLLFVNKFTCIM